MDFKKLFPERKPLIGMVHLLPLPGSIHYDGNLELIIERAKKDVNNLQSADFDGIIVENFSDIPYPTGDGPLERTVAFTIILNEIRRIYNRPLGVNIQFNDFKSEIITAGLCGADFIRVEAFVDSVTTAGGISTACSANLLRLRKEMGFEHVAIFADVHVKEASLIGNTTFEESIKYAESSGADAVIVTGKSTGQSTPMDKVLSARNNTSLEILIGSGFNHRNAKEVMTHVDGVIVGSSIKVGGKVSNPIDLDLAQELVKEVRER